MLYILLYKNNHEGHFIWLYYYCKYQVFISTFKTYKLKDIICKNGLLDFSTEQLQ